MTVWITADLHLGHRLIAELRGFHGVHIEKAIAEQKAVAEHDRLIMENLQRCVGKRDKLFVLGDVGFGKMNIAKLADLQCASMVLVTGNHDGLRAREWLEGFEYNAPDLDQEIMRKQCPGIFDDVTGAIQYKGMILSHFPLHPMSLHPYTCNLHGHWHIGTEEFNDVPSPKEGGPYLNVNLEFHNMMPWSLDEIEEQVGQLAEAREITKDAEEVESDEPGSAAEFGCDV